MQVVGCDMMQQPLHVLHTRTEVFHLHGSMQEWHKALACNGCIRLADVTRCSISHIAKANVNGLMSCPVTGP